MKMVLYCRVSTVDQTLDHQRSQAEAAGFRLDDHGVSGASVRTNITSAQADFWAPRIKAAMFNSFAAMMEVGRLLNNAKAALDHGDWLPLLQSVGLEKRTAQIWMKVARNPRFANASHDSLLPASLGTLVQICKLPEADYQRLRADGSINPATTQREVSNIVRNLRQAEDIERVRKLAPVRGKFRTIVIDPPWKSGGGRGCPYATMTQQQLLDLKILDWLEENAHVYLWATNAEILNASRLMAHWGLTFKEMLVWNKTYANGEPRMGMGHHFRHTCEFILFGLRGTLPTRQQFGTTFEAPVVGEHSSKPDRFYDIVRAASHPTFGEVFQRKPRDGFVNLYRPDPLIKIAA